MLKNKIYSYLFNEILKNFITVLLTFTAIAWTVRAVNFLELMVDDGYNSLVYFKYSVLNIPNIVARFVPLSFLISLTISIIRFEKKQELLILWTTGLNKLKVVNIFLLIAFFLTLFQIILSSLVNPFLLNKSRSLLRDTASVQFNSVLRSNDFSDAFKGITFYVDKKNDYNELINIFIKDQGGNFNTIVGEASKSKDTIIVAKKGFINNGKLILFNGIIQTLNNSNEFKNIQFEKTELSLLGLSTRTVKQPKIQETSSSTLLRCVLNQNNNLNLNKCTKNYKGEAVQNLLRRLGSPMYIPLITIIISFLLVYKEKKKFNFLKKYILFFLSFLILVIAEILLKYTGVSSITAISYFILPLIMSIFFYLYLLKKTIYEKGHDE